jgi:hypothetical protein
MQNDDVVVRNDMPELDGLLLHALRDKHLQELLHPFWPVTYCRIVLERSRSFIDRLPG